jgi:radical SAM superfamily enzyme YgiQ (UPF0313 family)
MKVLLIEPPFHRFMGFYRHYYPLGLAYIASVLESNGHIVSVYDAEHDPNAKPTSFLNASENYIKYLDALKDDTHPIWSEIQREISHFNPDIIGISILTVKEPCAQRIATLCREINDQIPIVVGGEHPTTSYEELLKNGNIDYVVRGEGEQTMLEFADTLETNGRLELVGGVSFKHNHRFFHNANRALIDNLDVLPFPARDRLTNPKTYRPIDYGLLMGSRGCSYNCTFCPNQSIWGRRVRFRSIQNIVNEIELVQEKYATRFFSFRDYSFSINSKWTSDFCNFVREKKLDIEWECLTRPDLLNEKLILTMRDAGCTTFRIGIESGSEKILQDIEKDISLREIRRMAEILNRHNIFWAAYFMFGLPSETEEDIQKTLSFIDEINPPFVTMSRFTPLPGSTLYEQLVQEGKIERSNIDWAQWGNQWLQKSFSRINRERFQEIIKEVANHIDEHNKRDTRAWNHPLFR